MTFAPPRLPSLESIRGTTASLSARLADADRADVLTANCLDVAVFGEAAALALRDQSGGSDRSALLVAADAFRAVNDSLDGCPDIPMPAAQAIPKEPAPDQPTAEAEMALATLAGDLLAALARLSELQRDPDVVATVLRAGLHVAIALASLTRVEPDAGHVW